MDTENIDVIVPPKEKVVRLSVYLGYNLAGRTLKAQIKALSHDNRMSIGKLIIDALKAKYGDFSQI